jgi:tetratricopeptide (TPR) repeat protein
VTRDAAVTHRRWWTGAAPVILVAVGVAVYWGTLDVPFVFDDFNAIVANPNIRQLLPLSQSLSAPEQSTIAGRPVVAMSLAVNYAISGLEPWSYHVTNIAVHLFAGLVLLGIVRRTLDLLDPEGTGRFPGAGFALAVAAVWLVHPLHTEAVTYVSTRTESLMGLLFLISLYALIRIDESDRQVLWIVVCIGAAALAMATKEVAVVIPVVLLAFDAVFLSDGVVDGVRRRPALWAGLAATWAVLLALMIGGPRSGTVGLGFEELTPVDYARTQVGVIWHYLRLAVWPDPLVLDYFDWPIARRGSAIMWLAGATLAALALASIGLAQRRHWSGFVGVWFFAILAPTSSVVPIVSEVAAERRMYLPLVAVVVLGASAVWWLTRRAEPVRRSPLRATTACVVCVVLGSITIARNHDYRTEVAIWEDTLSKRPGNSRAMENLAVALVRLGDRERAAGLFRAALELSPGSADANEGLGGLLLGSGRRDEGIERLRNALALNPESPIALENLGLVALEEGRLVEALEMLERCASLRPLDAVSRLNLAKALFVAGNPERALGEVRAAVQLAPDNGLAHARLALLLALNGNAGEATHHAERALDLAPNHDEVRRIVDEIRRTPARTHHAGSDPVASELASIATAARSGRVVEARERLSSVVSRVDDSNALALVAQRCFIEVDRWAAVELLRVATERDPSSPELHHATGRLLAESGLERAALDSYRTALALRPGWSDAGNSLALLLATADDPAVRDPDEALRIARELAAVSSPPHPILLGTLGVALAAAGDAVEADVVLARAVTAAGGEPTIAAHLERYRAMVAAGWPPPPGSAGRRDRAQARATAPPG